MEINISKSTITYLQRLMPGQSIDWYARFAEKIHSGELPMPSFDGNPPPIAKGEFPSTITTEYILEPVRPRPIIPPSAKSKRKKSHPAIQESRPVNPATVRELVLLCQGDAELAKRLALHEVTPGRDAQWAYEMAIYKIVKDRR